LQQYQLRRGTTPAHAVGLCSGPSKNHERAIKPGGYTSGMLEAQ
jgi:hypothetical protein